MLSAELSGAVQRIFYKNSKFEKTVLEKKSNYLAMFREIKKFDKENKFNFFQNFLANLVQSFGQL